MNQPAALVVLLLLLILLLAGQRFSGIAAKPGTEAATTFGEEAYGGRRYRLGKPEATRDHPVAGGYPLVVYLHDAGLRGSDNARPAAGLSFLGSGDSAQAVNFRAKYPCFVYVPQCPEGQAWEGEILDQVVATIAHLQATYPVDAQRLYLIGYSMGGSGTYELAGRYFAARGRPVAALIRLAGQSAFPPDVHDMIARSGVWLHVGLKDTRLRVDRAREAYAILKKLLANPAENEESRTVNGRERHTLTLTVAGRERVKLSEYPGEGHGISHRPFDDPAVLAWLFAQSSTEPEPPGP